jgi:DNA-binding MarR family transcriptional regulator
LHEASESVQGSHQAELFTSTLKISPNEIKALKLIEALECDQLQSQRDLAYRLDISLGLVNALLKRFVKKGYFKVRTLPKGRMKYILTPKGIAEKSILTYRYIIYSLSFYRELQSMFRSIFSNLKEEGKKRIVLFGNGELAEIASGVMKGSNLHLVGVVDQANQLHHFEYDIILVLELEDPAAIERCLINAGIPKHKLQYLNANKIL